VLICGLTPSFQVWSVILNPREALDVDGHGRGLPYKLCDVLLGHAGQPR
jgi:hypothetical protein